MPMIKPSEPIKGKFVEHHFFVGGDDGLEMIGKSATDQEGQVVSRTVFNPPVNVKSGEDLYEARDKRMAEEASGLPLL